MSTRYKYSENTVEATEMFFNVETNGEYIGIEQGSVMKRIPTSLLKSEILAEIDEAKADKDTDAVVGNFASFDADGNPIDSGKKDADYEDADDTILKKAQVKDNLTSTDVDLPLSANQGKVLKDAQDVIKGAGWTDETVKGNADAIDALDARIVDVEAHVYGLDFNEATGVSARLLDAVGKTTSAPDGTQAITSDFDNLYPWSAMKHVKVNMMGLEKEQHDHDYNAFDGEMMTVIPEYWYKDYRYNGHRYMYISDKKKQGFKYRKEMKIASFPASKVGTQYRSRVGEAPKTNESYLTFIQGFYAQGDKKWSMYDCLHSLVLLSCIEAGHMNHKGAYGRGINSGMPYSSSSSYNLTVATVDGNTLTFADASQPFHVGMTIQVGTTYTNNSIAQDRIITDVKRLAGVLTLTVDGTPFSAPIGSGVVSWGQSVPQEIFDTIGDGSGYIKQYGNQNMSHVAYRGIWDLWGNVYQFYAGLMRYDGRYYGCVDPTKYNISDPRGADGWVDLGVGEYADNGYQQIREGIDIEGGTIDVPILWGGSTPSSETYYSAYLYYFTSVYSGARVLLLGGFWNYGGDVSLVYSYGSFSPSSGGISFGSRLIRS